MKRIELLKHLHKEGCFLLREGANHSVYINPNNNRQSVVGRHQELDNRVCKEICKQLEISKIR
jgi:mRNA interferase HicA